MPNLYEGMFLLDNDVVREDWGKAKALVTETLAKHGAEMKTARRWDERKLAYRIKKRQRATFLLCYFEAPGAAITPACRDFDIREGVLRYLMLRSEEIPAEELTLSEAELAKDFVVPEPPADDAPDVEEPAAEEKPAPAEGKAEDGEKAKSDDAKDEAAKSDDADAKGEVKAGAAPAEATPETPEKTEES